MTGAVTDTGAAQDKAAHDACGDQAPSTLVIQPTRGWSSLGLGDVWEYRELLYFLLWREVKGKYRQMALGPLWILLKPLFSMVVFTLVFGNLAKLPSDGKPYAIFSYAALLPWTFFSGAVSSATTSLVGNQNLISKVYFPRMVVPISAALSGLVDLFFSFVVLAGLLAYYRLVPGVSVLLLPAYILFAAAAALAIGFWLAALTVKYRDVGFAVGQALAAWQYLSPVVYASSMVPARWRFLYFLNPMANVIDGFRAALLGTAHPPVLPCLLSAAAVALLLVTGAFYFRRTERTIVDIL